MAETETIQKESGLLKSFLIFGIASVFLILETHFLIPFLSQLSGLEPVIFWFIVAAFGIFFPLLVVVYILLKNEGLKINKTTWQKRLCFKKMNKGDWLWSFGSIIVIGILSLTIIKILEIFIGKVDSQPTFMYFEPLTPGRYWILLIWLPYWILNIMGEEILWRGVLLPQQEKTLGKYTWIFHGMCWGIFHLAFGWQLLLTLLPILFILPFIVQKRQNSWIGVVIHAVINGPSFLAISFGLM